MTDATAPWLLAVGGGGVLAAVYLASLWWIVQRVARTGRSWLLVGSYLVRMPIAALALLGIAAGDALRLLAAVAGFVAIRIVLVGCVRGGLVLPSAARLPAKER